MADWGSVLAAYWALWLIDGAKRAPASAWRVVGGRAVRRLAFSRLQAPGLSPTSWRTTAEEIPFSLSPVGLCNRPAGTMGRPAEGPAIAVAWRWEEITTVESREGWLVINGRRFCRDTGHLPASHLLDLARLAPGPRAERIHWRIRRWLRPAHLRRRVVVLRRHTAAATAYATAGLGLALLISVYLVAQVPTHATDAWNNAVSRQRPLLAAVGVALHVAACVAAARSFRRLKPVSLQKRATALLSAALVPPHALRLRALAGDGFFPAQHPVAFALAQPAGPDRDEAVRAVLTDLRWPIDDCHDGALAREISDHFRAEWTAILTDKLGEAGLSAATLLAPPMADAPGSTHYCQRCRDQFLAGPTHCPKGVPLAPTRPMAPTGCSPSKSG